MENNNNTENQETRKVISFLVINGIPEPIYSDMNQYDVRELSN